mmetsp:Transcript_30429/g.52097  ORF Transcript_30429/g.52097 Transcript_30429/m.52097 type:complete len:551 (-) Transcript_30429:1246-2898(-)
MLPLLADTVEFFFPTVRVLPLVLLVTILLWFRSKLARQKLISPIPGVEMVPGGHWFYGHIKHVMGPIKVGDKDYFDQLFVDYANEQGLCCAHYMEPAISVLSAKHARTILRQTSRRGAVKMIQRHSKQTLGQQSLILQSGGSDWKRQRGLVQYALTADAITEHNPIIIEVANAMVTALTNVCKAESNGVIELDVVHIAQCFTLEAFGKLALGHDFHCFSDSGIMRSREAEAFAFLVNDIPKRSCPSAVFNPLLQMYFLPTAYNRRYKMERGIVESLLSSVIKQSKDEFAASSKRDSSKSSKGGPGKKTRDNLLTHIIRASTDNSDDNLIDMMKTILFAGYETTAITITFVLYNLTKYPEMQELCCEEARRILQRDDSITISDLRYTRAVILESMRLNPTVVFTSRNLTKTINLDGFEIPKGLRVVIPLTKLLVDERNFERAKEFIPTRWVRWNEEKNEWVERDHRKESTDHGEAVSAADPANFLAFSDGARDCVGKRLAMNESTVALASLMKHFRVSYDESKPVEMKRRLTSWFPHELHIKFHLRDDNAE